MRRWLTGLMLGLACHAGVAAESYHIEFAHAATVQHLLTLAPPQRLHGIPGVHIERHGQEYVLRSGELGRRDVAESMARRAAGRLPSTPRVVSASGGQSTVLSMRNTAQSALLPLQVPIEGAAPARPAAAVPPAAAPAPSPAAAAGVDEATLWHWLAARKLHEYDRALFADPDRRIPPRMAALRDDLEAEAVLAGGEVNAVRTLLRERPATVSCRRPDRVERAATLLDAAADPDAALALYRRVLVACRSPRKRIDNLYLASALLDHDSAETLIAAEAAGGRRDAASEERFQTLRHQRGMDRLSRLDPASPEAAAALEAESAAIVRRREADGADLGGWIRYQQGDIASAQRWFARAVDWRPELADARYGLALMAFKLGRLDEADRLAEVAAKEGAPAAKSLRADIAVQRAVAANRAGQFALSQQWLDESENLGADPHPMRALRAWNRYGLHDFAAAAPLFGALYRDSGDLDSARGYVLSSLALERWDALQRELDGGSGTLTDEYHARESERLAGRELYLAAQARVAALDGRPAQADAPVMGAIASPSVNGGLAFSSQSGDDGTSRLTTRSQALGAEYIAGPRYLDVQYRTVWLDAGTAPAQAAIGSMLAGGRFAGTGSATSAELQQVAARWGEEGWLGWELGVAATQGGDAATGFEGMARLRQQTGNGYWELQASRRAVEESVLSWRGLSDPANPAAHWGAVTRNGVGVRLFDALGGNWGMSLAASQELLMGDNVANNQAWHLALGLGHDLKPAGYRYATLGPQLSVEGYRYNQSHYTWGQGGYYSPQSHVFVGGGLQWLSVDGRRWQWRGSLAAGYSQDRQAAVLYRDASSQTLSFAGSSHYGPAANVQLSAAMQLAAHWQLSATAAASASPGNSRQWQGSLNLRYLFDARSAVFSRDLPADAGSATSVAVY
ncbi:cellulose synthase subunit BcsC-related outer membrane protein [Paludibacterium yongneupense]|uniref:cellulose synthase subunit BcsC-related outer membrane protein n=1 Tax=Paludibacterium yongneupense TaxID=400061 RepID=UPI0004118339|nr:cellulose synthase subunit BcsC-related outer membrane protein [Paludibacterium yongneupense]